MANSNKNKSGRPPKYNSSFHPQDFIEQSKTGKHLFQIAASWDICRDTIHDWSNKHKEFSDAVKKGQLLAEAWYMERGMNAMQGKENIHLGFFVWLTKNKFKWADKVEETKKMDEKQFDELTGFKFLEPKKD